MQIQQAAHAQRHLIGDEEVADAVDAFEAKIAAFEAKVTKVRVRHALHSRAHMHMKPPDTRHTDRKEGSWGWARKTCISHMGEPNGKHVHGHATVLSFHDSP